MKHFPNYNVLMDTTKKIRQSNTVDFFPTTNDNTTITPTKTLSLIIEDLFTVLKNSPPMSPFLPQLLGLTNEVGALQSILRPPAEEVVQEQRVQTPQIHCIDLTSTPKPSTPSTVTIESSRTDRRSVSLLCWSNQ